MESYRLNSPSTSAITLEVLGHQLQFCQDPNSRHLGTTVWDASMVFVKYLEKNCRKGRFSPSKLKGKRVIELGAGCGVAGFGMALLGCDVMATDQDEVLPLLRRNTERNTSRIMQMNPDSAFGSMQVAELDWGNNEHIKILNPPFDYIVGTDVVYAEHLLEPLLQTIHALSGPKTTLLLGYEIRSTSVHEQMLDMWRRNFEVKIVPKVKMDIKYQHPSIQLFIMVPKQAARSIVKPTQMINRQNNEAETEETSQKEEDNEGSTGNQADKVDDLVLENVKVDNILLELKKGNLTEWEERRYGSMAARLLRDIKIT